MKKNLLILTLVTIAIPSFAFASWWNPTTWFNGWNFSHNTEIQIESTSSSTLPFGLSRNASTTTRSDFDPIKYGATPFNSTTSTTTDIVIKKVPKKSPPISTTIPVPTQPTESVDQYGMTNSDWTNETAGIQSVRDRISSNNDYITKIQGYITSTDSLIGTVSKSMSMGGLDATGKQYAQNYIDLAQKLESGYKNEISITNSINDLLNQMITATYAHNKSLITSLGNGFTDQSKQLSTLINQDVALSAQEMPALNTFTNYYSLLIKNYSATQTYTAPIYVPTYIPTYVPQTQQYNTNCSGSGSTISCTTYAPSSSAISTCTHYLTDGGTETDFANAMYQRCLQDNR